MNVLLTQKLLLNMQNFKKIGVSFVCQIDQHKEKKYSTPLLAADFSHKKYLIAKPSGQGQEKKTHKRGPPRVRRPLKIVIVDFTKVVSHDVVMNVKCEFLSFKHFFYYSLS